MVKKSFFIWLAILPLAILNGALRDTWLNPWLGEERGQPVSAVLLCVIIFAVCYFGMPKLGRGASKSYWEIGLWWMLWTVLFETCFGLLEGNSLAELLKAYNPATGNLWLLVVLFVGMTPYVAAKARKFI